MRELGKFTAFFCEDISGGGIKIECQGCKNVFDDFTKWGEQTICPKCKSELYYPPGASW